MYKVINNKELKWIFVSGKGGVGKTTCSCSLGIQLAKHRDSVLIISTDPAHNLSDAFGQKFNSNPGLVNGYSNLYCMEHDTNERFDKLDEILGNMPFQEFKTITDIMKSMPGIEEALGYISLMKKTSKMNYSVIIFDSSPTGHALKLLSYPEMIKKSYEKLIQSRLSSMFSMFVNSFSGMNNTVQNRLDTLIGKINYINDKLTDCCHTIFIPVCIPEFLSVFETERMIQEIYRMGIDSNTMIVNQIIDNNGTCSMCVSRRKIQNKYLDMIDALYTDLDFDIIYLPLQQYEIRKNSGLNTFSELLYTSDYSNKRTYEKKLDKILDDTLNDMDLYKLSETGDDSTVYCAN